MNQAQLRAPQEFSKALLAVAPVAGNGPVNGAGIDRTGYTSVIVDHPYAMSGTPTGGTITAQLQTSSDGINFVNYGAPASAAVAASGVVTVFADLSGALQFIRSVVTAAPTGGTSPAATFAASARLFGPGRLPAL